MKVLRVSLSCPPPKKNNNFFWGLDVSIVVLESHDLHVIFSGDVLRIS